MRRSGGWRAVCGRGRESRWKRVHGERSVYTFQERLDGTGPTAASHRRSGVGGHWGTAVLFRRIYRLGRGNTQQRPDLSAIGRNKSRKGDQPRPKSQKTVRAVYINGRKGVEI